MINLLPPDYKRSMTLEQKILVISVICFLISSVAIGGSFYYSLVLDNNLLEEQIDMTQETLDQVALQVREVDNLKRSYDEAREELNLREESLGIDLNWPLILDQFREIAPRDTWIESFDISNQNFNLKGYIRNQRSLNSVINNLRDSEHFEEVRLVTSNKRSVSQQGYREEETYYFEMVGTIVDVRGDYYDVE